ncbi:MAG: MmgE/PrpD family protein [Alphaproteobacteria bacterium]|nr:MmgE/PrpD family protein [Alphaproteobacteria bacterium]
MTDAIEAFADHVLGTSYDDLPAKAVLAVKTFLLDSLGVGLAGTRGAYVEEWLGAYQGAVPGAGARVWGRGEPLPTPAAAAVIGYLIHNSEYDCVHEDAVLHPMATLLSALMVEAEARGEVDGKTLIRAIALGVDVACHIGNSVTTGLKFFRPATAGGFGAVAAIGVIAGLDREQLLNAFGLYYAQASGTMQAHVEGLAMLGMQVGFCSRNAVVAVRLAEAGIPGTRGTLEGPFGYLRLMEGEYDRGALLDSIGQIWRITEVAHKPFPSGRATHGVIDALIGLVAEHGITGQGVASVAASVPPLTHRLIGRPIKDGMTSNYARLSGPYTAARLLLGGGLGLPDFLPDALVDAATHDLGRRIVVEADDNPDPNALTPISVTVRMRDGAAYSASIDTVYGNPRKPMSREAHLRKFRENVAFAVGPIPEGNAEALIAMVDDLESLDDARRIVDLLVAA